MLKRIWFLFLLVLLGYGELPAKRLCRLPELSKPGAVHVTDRYIYISAPTTLFIYKRQPCQLIRRIGKAGEGPLEFKKNHMGAGIQFGISENNIYINSDGKLTILNRAGDLDREIRVPPMMHFIPAGDHFVSKTLHKGTGTFSTISIALFDSKLDKKSDLYVSDIAFGMGAPIIYPPENIDYRSAQGKIYISTGGDNIHILKFGPMGNSEGSIVWKLPSREVEKSYQDSVRAYYRTNPRTKNYWGYYQKHLRFRKKYPGIRSFLIDDGRIYVQSYITVQNQARWYIMDLKGNRIGTVLLPIIEVDPVEIGLHAMHRDKFFWITEGDDGEWELHSYPIRIQTR